MSYPRAQFYNVLLQGLHLGPLDPELRTPLQGHCFSILKIIQSLNRADSSPISNSVQRQLTRCLVFALFAITLHIFGDKFFFFGRAHNLSVYRKLNEGCIWQKTINLSSFFFSVASEEEEIRIKEIMVLAD